MSGDTTSAARRCTGLILAGGLATRMHGAAKGMSQVAGVPIVERVAAALRTSTDSLLLSIGQSDVAVALPGVPRVRDAKPGAGPRTGLQAGLAAAGGDVLVCAWDMPFVNASLLRELRRIGELGHDAVLPAGPDGRPEPLCAWYGAGSLAELERPLATPSSGAIVDRLEGCNVRIMPLAEVERFGNPATMFLNVNSPADLAHALSILPEAIEP